MLSLRRMGYPAQKIDEEHPEEYGKMIKESTDEELYKEILESGCSTDIQGGLFGLEGFVKEQK